MVGFQNMEPRGHRQRTAVMFNPILPARADNDYRGHKVALVLFGLLLVLKTGISLGSIFNGYAAATSADGIPLDSYTPNAARTVLSLFALLGLASFVICVVGVVVLVRYRSLIAFMFALMLVYQVGRYMILLALPIVRTGTPPGSAINLTILGMMLVGFALSLWRQRE